MKIGCVKEIKNREYRVGLIPDNAKSYVNAGHEVWIEKGAGLGSGLQTQNMKRPVRSFVIKQRKSGTA